MVGLNQKIPGEIFTGWDVLGIVYGATAFFMAPIIGGLMYNDLWKIGAWIKVIFFTTGSLWIFAIFCKFVLPANTKLTKTSGILIGILIGLLLSAGTMWRPTLDLYQGPLAKEGFLTFEYGRRNEIDILSFTDKEGTRYEFQETPTRSTEWLLEQEYCGRKAIKMTFLEYRKLRPVLSAKCLEAETLDYGP